MTRLAISGSGLRPGCRDGRLGFQPPGGWDGSGEALAARERALAALGPCRHPLTHWKLIDPWARALIALGREGEAQPAVARLRKMGYAGL
ncbi:MAG TPA: hypothetical protein VN493_09155 [Thermoanaerobaculia bacterium]|nr:hypothetical protein [Thermoanaerobaculia bacterium]